MNLPVRAWAIAELVKRSQQYIHDALSRNRKGRRPIEITVQSQPSTGDVIVHIGEKQASLQDKGPLRFVSDVLTWDVASNPPRFVQFFQSLVAQLDGA